MDDETSYISDDLEENTRDKIYICLSDTPNGEIYIVKDNNIFISQIFDEREGVIKSKNI